jgi:hypothetical protein
MGTIAYRSETPFARRDNHPVTAIIAARRPVTLMLGLWAGAKGGYSVFGWEDVATLPAIGGRMLQPTSFAASLRRARRILAARPPHRRPYTHLLNSLRVKLGCDALQSGGWP